MSSGRRQRESAFCSCHCLCIPCPATAALRATRGETFLFKLLTFST